MIVRIRSKIVEKIGNAAFNVFFDKPHLLIGVRVSTRIDASNLYTESNLTPYELGTAGYTNFTYDTSQLTPNGTRNFSVTTVISGSFPEGTKIKYVITYLEFEQ